MSDEFLTQFFEMPRAEFAQTLYMRISRQPQPTRLRLIARRLTFRNVICVFAVLFLIAAGVRTILQRTWNRAGDIWVDVRGPVNNSFPKEETTFLRLPGEESIILPEGEAALGFGFRFPSWIPDGFTLNSLISVYPRTPKYLYAVWTSQGSDEPIRLLLHAYLYRIATRDGSLLGEESTWPVASDSFEDIQVQGHVAVLVRGDWNWPIREVAYEEAKLDWLPFEGHEVTWNSLRGLSLYWTDGEVAYRLWTYNPNVTAADLIRMAESAK